MRALVTVAITISVNVARADMPLPLPAKVRAMSPSGGMRAISDPKAGTRVEDVKRHRVLWSLPDWHTAYSRLTMASIWLRSTMGESSPYRLQ